MEKITPYKIAIFASGDGSNAEQVIRRFRNHNTISVALVFTNNPEAKAMDRAAQLSIPSRIFDKKQLVETGEVKQWLTEAGVTHIVLAGFLLLMPPEFIRAFPNRIVNIHPALLPRFGGKGMFGRKVHEAVKASGELESGITIHLVNEEFDKGKILFQEKCSLLSSDSVEVIAKKVLALEHDYYPMVIEKWISGEKMPG